MFSNFKKLLLVFLLSLNPISIFVQDSLRCLSVCLSVFCILARALTKQTSSITLSLWTTAELPYHLVPLDTSCFSLSGLTLLTRRGSTVQRGFFSLLVKLGRTARFPVARRTRRRRRRRRRRRAASRRETTHSRRSGFN